MLELRLVLRPRGNGLGVGEKDLNLPIQSVSISSSLKHSPFKLIQSRFGNELVKEKLKRLTSVISPETDYSAPFPANVWAQGKLIMLRCYGRAPPINPAPCFSSAFCWPLAEVNSFSLSPYRFPSSLPLVMKFNSWWNAYFLLSVRLWSAVHILRLSLNSFLSALWIFWVSALHFIWPWVRWSSLQPLVGVPLFPHCCSLIAVLLALSLRCPWEHVGNFRCPQCY